MSRGRGVLASMEGGRLEPVRIEGGWEMGVSGVRGRRGPACSCRESPQAWEEVTVVLPLSHPVPMGKKL